MASYLYGVQDQTGREVLSACVSGVERVSEITARRAGPAVLLEYDGLTIESATYLGEGSLRLLRWPARDKDTKPVSHPIK